MMVRLFIGSSEVHSLVQILPPVPQHSQRGGGRGVRLRLGYLHPPDHSARKTAAATAHTICKIVGIDSLQSVASLTPSPSPTQHPFVSSEAAAPASVEPQFTSLSTSPPPPPHPSTPATINPVYKVPTISCCFITYLATSTCWGCG